ncbi:MAG TPA: DUF3102 domain-containing protein [Verrucomicrobiota bacterium]|nr:DUF3102 domain-containing protein [Verrucomicrobiota bacterium]
MNELTFDYDALPKKDIQFVKQTTREVNLLLERSTGDIIAIGHKLIEMKNRLGHGHWRSWLLTQWPLDISLANRWMNVARKCGQFPHLEIPRSTLYLLAANSTPDTLRDEFVRRVEAGQPPMTHSELKAEIESHRPEPASTGNKSAPKAAAPSLREEILACLDQAASLLNGKNAAALKALESARNLVVSLNE